MCINVNNFLFKNRQCGFTQVIHTLNQCFYTKLSISETLLFTGRKGVFHIFTSPTADTADIFLNIFNEKPIFSRKEVIHIMKIICSKTNLLKSVSISLKAVPSKTTMPILECILIDATANQIKFTTNDMELGIETIVDGSIEEKGMVALNAKIFYEIIRRLPDNDVTIKTDDKYTATITCEKAKFNIPGKSGEDFAYLPMIERDDPLTISQYTLKNMIYQTIFSIAVNDNNKLMTGELFEIKNNCLKIVSLDGHRIAIRKMPLKKDYSDRKVVVPGKTLNEISKILSGEMDDVVSIYFTNNHILFEFDQTMVVSRLIEGEYFRIDQMLSSDYETKLSINKKEFLDCIDRATLLVREGDKKPIIIHITDNNMELKIDSAMGSMNEDIDIEKEGKDILIGFNPKFLIDALKVIDDEMIDIYLVNPKAPCFIRDEEETYTYLILPVNINQNQAR